MKARSTILAAAMLIVLGSAVFAQSAQQEGSKSVPQPQQLNDPPEIDTRTAAPTTRQGEMPQTTTYTNPPAPPVAEAPAPVIETAPPVVEAEPPAEPAPVAAETTTIATEYEELPGSATAYPSLALGGLLLLTAGALIRRKSR